MQILHKTFNIVQFSSLVAPVPLFLSFPSASKLVPIIIRPKAIAWIPDNTVFYTLCSSSCPLSRTLSSTIMANNMRQYSHFYHYN